MSPNLFDRIDGLLARVVPPAARPPARRFVYLPVDLWEAALGRRDPLLPPRGLRGVGAGDFVAVGEEFARLLVELCGLAGATRILDVGCGIGRVAIPLTRQLDDRGTYDGFDVSRAAIRWCGRRISRRHPNFRFLHVDVRSAEYNWRGRIAPESFRFPYEDASFDVACAVSLLTHLLPAASRHYLAETARVLRPGGCCLASLFVLNEASRAVATEGRGAYRFPAQLGEARVHDPARPEAAVAHDESAVRAWCAAANLELVEPIHYGAWCGGVEALTFQDLVVARKRG